MSEQIHDGKPETDEVLQEQEGKGYGEDEGERDEALENEDSESA